MNNIKKPEWAPENSGKEFASKVIPGVSPSPALPEIKHPGIPLIRYSTNDFREKILSGDRAFLARAMTLIESQSEKHRNKASELINAVLPFSGNSIRIGISGVPGAGKSTLIDALGFHLAEKGHKIAVLAVDPSSSISKGSILGDKTRMEKLARHSNSFIRPSPSGGALGGVAQKTREMILLAEAAGFDVIMIETVGIGQNEITVRSMTDFFVLTLISGGGDELQGIKKGVIEITDMILINKADGDNKQKAELAKSQYEQALHYLTPYNSSWKTPVKTCSAYTGNGLKEIWKTILEYRRESENNGFWYENRQKQRVQWFQELIKLKLEEIFHQHPQIKKELPEFETKIQNNEILVDEAVNQLFELFHHKN